MVFHYETIFLAACTLLMLGNNIVTAKSVAMGHAPKAPNIVAEYELDGKDVKFTVTGTAKDGGDAFWLGFGFNKKNTGMAGLDVFVCSDGKVTRDKNVQGFNKPSGDQTSDTCTQDAGKTVMTITVADFDLENPPYVAWAWGANGQKSVTQHSSENRGYTEFSGKVSISTSGLLWGHAILMSLSWGFMLPFGVMSAMTLRSSEKKMGGKPIWFYLHENFQYMGWTLQLVGFILIVVEFHNDGREHFKGPHMIIGFVVWLLGTLQPLNAYFRPHAHKDADKTRGCADKRTKWEYLHKNSGYIAVLLGLINCILGVYLVWSMGKEPLNIVVLVILISTTLVVLVAGGCNLRGFKR